MKPIVTDLKPTGVELEAGKDYYYCACGRSQTQPFCDGSHKGTGFTPIPFQPDETGTAWLCMCRQSGGKPFCDGSHKQVDPESKGCEHGAGPPPTTP